jgi:hypothetical protein
MQIPQQPPEEEQRQASQPLYEFVTDTSSLPASQEETGQDHSASATSPEDEKATNGPASDTRATATDPNWPPPSAEAIRQGLVYPPPPSFYQNAEQEAGQPFPPPSQAPGTPGTATLPPPAMPPFALPVGYGAGGGPGTEHLPPPFMPIPPSMPMPPVRKSRKWMWIVITMLAGVLVLSCGLCTWAGYMLVAPTVQDETTALSLVNNYYDTIQARNYTAAYSYLAPKGTISGLTREQFIQQAEARDTRYGPVHSYTPGQAAINGNSGGNSPGSLNLSYLTITVNVTRTQLKYPVALSLEKINGTWKIVDFGGI